MLGRTLVACGPQEGDLRVVFGECGKDRVRVLLTVLGGAALPLADTLEELFAEVLAHRLWARLVDPHWVWFY